MRNIQLSFLSLPFGLFTCLVYDWKAVTSQGFFFGYDAFIWYLVVLQATGGLLVAMVVKYAGNLKFSLSSVQLLNCFLTVAQITSLRASPRLWPSSCPVSYQFIYLTSIWQCNSRLALFWLWRQSSCTATVLPRRLFFRAKYKRASCH